MLNRRPITETPVIDAHAHLGPMSEFFIPNDTAAAMVEVMDRVGVGRAVVSAHESLESDARGGNEAVAAAVEEFPERLRGYVVVNPWQDPEAEVQRWAGDKRFVGMKLHSRLHRYPLRGPRNAPVWALAEESGWPVLAHTGPGGAESSFGVGALEPIAQAHPRATILAGHSGYSEPGFDTAIEVATLCPNVVLELCGSFMRRDVIARMVDEVGSDKVVFGSDFPFADLRMTLGKVAFASISDSDQAAVLGGTMAGLIEWS